jgi:hypothetical protein
LINFWTYFSLVAGAFSAYRNKTQESVVVVVSIVVMVVVVVVGTRSRCCHPTIYSIRPLSITYFFERIHQNGPISERVRWIPERYRFVRRILPIRMCICLALRFPDIRKCDQNHSDAKSAQCYGFSARPIFGQSGIFSFFAVPMRQLIHRSPTAKPTAIAASINALVLGRYLVY